MQKVFLVLISLSHTGQGWRAQSKIEKQRQEHSDSGNNLPSSRTIDGSDAKRALTSAFLALRSPVRFQSGHMRKARGSSQNINYDGRAGYRSAQTLNMVSTLDETSIGTDRETHSSKAHQGDPSLAEFDTEVWDLMNAEAKRQNRGIELIASENFVSKAVLQALGSVMTNKYSEGLPGARYYGGNEIIDKVESLCQSRALQTYDLDPNEWGVNVQPYSGSPANFAVYTALLNPHDRIMGLDLPSGGHLTHGYYTDKKKVSATSVYFESLPYKVNAETGLIDYDALEELASVFRPKILIAGASSYPREWDYKRMREIADKVGAILMTDMAHISGLIAAGEAQSPFEYSDVVTSTTHKSLRGPRSGIIFSKRHLTDKIDFAVFPALQGGPHNHQIAALAVAFKEAQTPEFRQYASQIRKNAKALAEAMQKRGFKLVTEGTDNHIVLWNVRDLALTGSKLEKLLERCSISVNKNAIHGDVSAASPGGVRLGTPAMTSRGLLEADFEQVADFLQKAAELAIAVQAKSGKKLVDFVKLLDTPSSEGGFADDVSSLRDGVEKFASGFRMPGPSITESPLP